MKIEQFVINDTLESIHFKYERLASLVSLLQMVAAEVAEINNVPKDSFTNALYEIERGLEENNEKLRGVMDAIHSRKTQL